MSSGELGFEGRAGNRTQQAFADFETFGDSADIEFEYFVVFLVACLVEFVLLLNLGCLLGYSIAVCLLRYLRGYLIFARGFSHFQFLASGVHALSNLLFGLWQASVELLHF